MSSNELISLTSELINKSNKKNSKTLLLTNELEELKSNILSIIETSSSDTNNANSITNAGEISVEKYHQLVQELRLREEEIKTQKNLINFYEFNLKNCLNEFYFKLLKIKANSVNNSYNNAHIQNLVNENLMLKEHINQFKKHLVELVELESEDTNVGELVDKLVEVNNSNINAQNSELIQLREENEALRYLLGISSDPNLDGFSEGQLQILTKQLIEGIDETENSCIQ